MIGRISYFNAELDTQSLLKINTKENPKVAKPIFIPFIFLFFSCSGLFCLPPDTRWLLFLPGPILSVVVAPFQVLDMQP